MVPRAQETQQEMSLEGQKRGKFSLRKYFQECHKLSVCEQMPYWRIGV